MHKLASVTVAVALGLAALGARAAAPLVANGDFSTSLGTSWYSNDGTPILRFRQGFVLIDEGQGIHQSISLAWNTAYQLSFMAVGSGTVSLWGLDLPLRPTSGGAAAPEQTFGSGLSSYRFSTGPATQAYAYTHLDFSAGPNQAFTLDNVNVSAVPEPASGAMLLAGLGLVGLLRRRRAPAG